MSDLVTDCPRCGANDITFDLVAATRVGFKYDWQSWYEAFCVCRRCLKATTFVVVEKDIEAAEQIKREGLHKTKESANRLVDVRSFINLKDLAAHPSPEYVPANIKGAFDEGARCLSVTCPNAAATMFRLCVDIATRSLLPPTDVDGLTPNVRRSLGLRLPWLFERGLLPVALQELSECVKADGNDGAHEGTLQMEDAEDLLDFTSALLERLYAEPERLRLAKERRAERRGRKEM